MLLGQVFAYVCAFVLLLCTAKPTTIVEIVAKLVSLAVVGQTCMTTCYIPRPVRAPRQVAALEAHEEPHVETDTQVALMFSVHFFNQVPLFIARHNYAWL